MASWRDLEDSSDSSEEELTYTGMDMDVWKNHDTTIDASFCGSVADPQIKCKLHQFRGRY